MAFVSDLGMSQSAKNGPPLFVLCRHLSLVVVPLVVKMVVKTMGLYSLSVASIGVHEVIDKGRCSECRRALAVTGASNGRPDASANTAC